MSSYLEKEVWKEKMDQAVKEKRIKDIVMLWSFYEELEEKGRIELPF